MKNVAIIQFTPNRPYILYITLFKLSSIGRKINDDFALVDHALSLYYHY